MSKLASVWLKILLFGFRLLYNELAWTYDFVSWVVSLGQWREWQRAGLQFLSGENILELAHGPGHMLVELEEAGFRVTGLDFSEAMVHMARRRLIKAGSTIITSRGLAQQLPYPDGSFDSLLATFPAEFIVDPRTIDEANRVLMPNGRLVIVAQAKLERGGILRLILEWLYTITGQRPAKSDGVNSLIWQETARRYIVGGFDVDLEQVELDGSLVTVVVANKRNTPAVI
jgi:ubiquinone/menaquinone biosynthesis C-methylase UbiE